MPRKLCNMKVPVSYTHLRAHETSLHLVCRLLLEKTHADEDSATTEDFIFNNHFSF